MTGPRPAVFLDRDGTLIDDVHYIADPDAVVLRPGAAAAVAALNRAGRPAVVVTNQSGIARGIVSPAAYERVRARLDDVLAADGAWIDATYHCPHHPDFGAPCDCRKPGLALFRRAAADLALDLARSAWIGDRWRDVEPAIALGGLGILVPSPQTPPADAEHARAAAAVADGIAAAVAMALAGR